MMQFETITVVPTEINGIFTSQNIQRKKRTKKKFDTALLLSLIMVILMFLIN